MVIDSFTFNGEYDLLEIRFNILDPFVDSFVISESKETFSGKPKPLYWEERDKERFKKWEGKVRHVISSYGGDQRIMNLIDSRDYVDQPAFKRAFYQKEAITSALTDLDDEDIVFYGDVDEIWKPIRPSDDKVYKLRQLAYSYYLNNRSSEDWRGTIVTRYKNIRNGCLNDMRANPVNVVNDGGWHFTNLGGHDSVIKKLESYDHEEANIPWVKDNLAERMEKNIDFLGREFKMWTDDSQLPQYLLDNKEKWKHLWK